MDDKFSMLRDCARVYLEAFHCTDWCVSFCVCESMHVTAQIIANPQEKLIQFNMGRHWECENSRQANKISLLGAVTCRSGLNGEFVSVII